MEYAVVKKRAVTKPQRAAKDEVITFEKFLEIAPESKKADLLDGKIIRDSSPVPKHGRIVSWLVQVLGLYVEKKNLGEVFTSPITVRLSTYQGPEPDVFFISKERAAVVVETHVDGPPDLCIEVISKSSRKYDRGRKFVLYADHGVKEYWIVDPLADTIELFENRAGAWQMLTADELGRIRSKVLNGFWIKPEWLGRKTLPPVLQALQEIFGDEKRLI